LLEKKYLSGYGVAPTPRQEDDLQLPFVRRNVRPYFAKATQGKHSGVSAALRGAGSHKPRWVYGEAGKFVQSTFGGIYPIFLDDDAVRQ